MNFGDATDVLTDTGTYTEMVAAGGAGYMAPVVAENLGNRFVPMDVPSEAYGLAVIAGAEVAGVPYKRAVQTGAGAYTAEQVAERVGVKSTITNLGAEGGN